MGKINLENPSFIESILQIKAASFSVEEGCAEGDNVAGTLKSINVRSEDGQTLRLIIKFISDNAPGWIYESKIFHVEYAMYTHIFPLLRRFVMDHGVNYSPAIPKYIAGSIEESHEYLCLEDLRPLGYRMPDKTKSLSFGEMSLVLKELAKFHAVSYAMIQYEGTKVLDAEETRILRFNIDEKFTQGDMIACLYFQETVKLWEERRPDLACRMVKLLSEHEWLKKSTRVNKKYFRTLIHHDLWTNNIMVKYDKNTGEPESVKFLDFQFVQEGNIFEDLQYLVFTSTTPEYRKHYLVSSLSTYFDEFEKILRDLKCQMPQGFTKGFLVGEFKGCYLSAYIRMAFAVALQLGDLSPVENQPEEPDISTRVRNIFLRSPIALERFDAITEELISNGFI